MYLKALELNGFKSFAEKTVIDFTNGITSIVGPNGSGKSNILDAILWVLGEQSYKSIRAKDSSDVIFSGGKNRKAKSVAEVSLIIDNSDRYLDIDFTDLKITRRIYRSGENEYLINNRKIRLKDINNLFMDTGIGKQAYSIIGQGRVEKIISSTPKELKELIEEAAGVKRAKTEKEESVKKLNDIQSEVEKIEYVENDLASRVSILKEQSDKAKLYKALTRKINTLKLMTVNYNINQKNIDKKDMKDKIEALNEKIKEVENEFSVKEAELREINQYRENSYTRLQEKKDANMEIFKELEILKNKISEINNRSSNLEVEFQEKGKRKDNIENELKEKNLVLENSKKELDEIKKVFDEKNNDKNNLEKELESIKEESLAIEKTLESLSSENRNSEIEKIKLNGELEDLEKRINLAKARVNSILKEKEKILEDFDKISATIKKYEEASSQNIENLEEKKQKLKINSEKLQEIQKNKDLILKKLNELNYKNTNLSTKKRAIENIIENNETFGRSIKLILNKKIDGVLGAFANLITIPEEYHYAVQILSGSNFQDIVTDNDGTAKKCIEILKNEKIGRASFLPLETIKTGRFIDRLPAGENIVGFVRDIVSYDKKIEKAAFFVFGNAILVKDLDSGLKILKNGFNDRIITVDGELITSRGRISGGFKTKGKDELFERKKELGEINSSLESLIKETELCTAEIEKAEILEKKTAEHIQEERIILQDLESSNRDFNNEFESAKSEYSRSKRELDTVNFEENDNKEFIEKQILKIEENKKIISQIDLNIENNNKLIIETAEKKEKIKDTGELTAKLNEISIESAILNEKFMNYKARYEEISSEYERLKNEKLELDSFFSENRNLKEELSVKNKEILDTINKKDKENSKLLEEIKELELEIRKLESGEKELISKVKDVETKIILNKNEHVKYVENFTKLTKELEYLGQEYEEMQSEEINDEEYEEISDDNILAATRRKMSVNEKSRMDIGPVNLASIEEYEKEEERYRLLYEQKEDLLKSRESLFTLIKDIEGEITEKFSYALKEINSNFVYMCKEILNNAKGEIKILDEENLLETGLELSVKYKNKPEQTLLLLSGGEKSMLAVSFIMAIFIFKPSPFTFFDEIEAALDDANTKKIVKLLNEFTNKSQFILITHNKETMKGSHRLYGVTMNKEIGESRIVSVDI